MTIPPPSRIAQLTSGAGVPAGGGTPPAVTGGGAAPAVTAGTSARDSDGAGLSTCGGSARPIHSALPGWGAWPERGEPRRVSRRDNTVHGHGDGRHCGRRGHHGAFGFEYHLTPAPAGRGRAGLKSGRDEDGRAGRGSDGERQQGLRHGGRQRRHPRHAQVLHQGLFRKPVHPAQQRLHLDPEQPDQGDPGIVGRRVGPVRGETADPGLQRRADRLLVRREQLGLAARQSGAVHDHRLPPGLGLPPPPHLAGALRAHGRPPAAAVPLPGPNRTVISPGATSSCGPIGTSRQFSQLADSSRAMATLAT